MKTAKTGANPTRCACPWTSMRPASLHNYSRRLEWRVTMACYDTDSHPKPEWRFTSDTLTRTNTQPATRPTGPTIPSTGGRTQEYIIGDHAHAWGGTHGLWSRCTVSSRQGGGLLTPQNTRTSAGRPSRPMPLSGSRHGPGVWDPWPTYSRSNGGRGGPVGHTRPDGNQSG